MASWVEFERLAPDFTEAARRLLIGSDEVAIAFLATVTKANAPRLAPVCLIFCGDHVYAIQTMKWCWMVQSVAAQR